jgi:CHASE3 domain sensor protein
MKLNLRTKLIGGFLIVVAALLGVFSIAYSGLDTMNANSEAIYGTRMRTISGSSGSFCRKADHQLYGLHGGR